MNKFIQNLAKQNKAHYDRLVDLMRYFNLIDVDMRLVSQLKASFISKDQGNIDQIPLIAFKETMRKVFQPFRQAEEIVNKIAECVVVEIGDEKQKMADSAKLSTLVEFMKCYPLMVKRDKNTSSGMDYVMDGARASQNRTGQNVSELQKTSDTASV